MADHRPLADHLTTDGEWDTLVNRVPADKGAAEADEKAKHDARHRLRINLRNRTAKRLDKLYDEPSESLRSWGSYLKAPGASKRPLLYIHAPLTVRHGAAVAYLQRETVRLGVHEMIERQFRYAQLVAEGKRTPGVHSDCDNTIEGTIAELAVAQALGLCWQPSGGVQAKSVGDLGPLEIKHTHHAEGDLLVPKSAPASRPFVLTVGAAPTYAVVGWLFGKDAKRKEWWDAKWRKYRVPQTAQDLKPITREFAQRAHAWTVRALPSCLGGES